MPFILQLHRFNIIVAFGAGTIAYGWCHFLGVQNSFSFALWVSLAVLCVYSGHRMYKCERNYSQPEINEWYVQNRNGVRTIFFLSIVFSFVRLDAQDFTLLQYLILGVGLLLSISYVVPVFKWRMREISFLKAPLVALVWTTIVIGLPYLQTGVSCPDFYPYAGAFFCYFLALTIPFDIRDLSFDKNTHRSIPSVFGIEKSRWLAILLILLSIFIIANINQNNWKNPFFAAAFLIPSIVIFFADERRKEGHYAALDATMILIGTAFFLAA